MSDTRDAAQSDRHVGDRVQVRRPGAPTTAGTLVVDYADSLIPAQALGRDWAAPHRWAVALDIGTLVFADDADLVGQVIVEIRRLALEAASFRLDVE